MEGLIEDLAADLDGAFPAVVSEHGATIFWGLRRMCGDHQEAEDLTQEALIRAYRALESYDQARIRGIDLKPWLWTIAMNLGRNHLRDRTRRPQFAGLIDVSRDDPEIIDNEAWDRRFARLSSPQRNAVVLRHLVGLGVGEISAITGRPEGTVKADIHRGLHQLKKALEAENEH